MRRIINALLELAIALAVIAIAVVLGAWIGQSLDCWLWPSTMLCGVIGMLVGGFTGFLVGAVVMIIGIARFEKFQRKRMALLEAEQEPDAE